jgi:nicotinamide-nucleotide amidase
VLPEVLVRFPQRRPSAGLVLRCAGAPEAELGRRVDAHLAGSPVPGLTVAYLAGDAEVQVKLRAVAATAAEAAAVIEAAAPGVRAVLGADCYGEGDVTLPGTVVRLLTARGETVGVAESLTAGLVSARIAEVPGASAVLRGGVAAYATDVKASVLGVPQELLDREGAVSEATAAAMASGVRALLATSWGIATTGVAGPDPQDGHPAGTLCLGIAGPDGVIATRRIRLPDGGRAWIRAASATLALDLLRRTGSGPGSGS